MLRTTISCDVWIWPLTVVRETARRNKELTVTGNFKKGRTIELDWLEYEGRNFDTDFLPPGPPVMHR